jgi:ComF family protein
LHRIVGAATNRGTMGGWVAFAVDLLLPRHCAACETALAPGHPHALCPPCWTSLRMPSGTLCRRCGIPLAHPLVTCWPCTTRPPGFDVARALGLYLVEPPHLNPLARAVRALKFRGHRAAGASLGAALADLLPLPADAMVVPVPLHVSRLRERGYNQAALLARGLARTARLRLAPRALVRRRPTPSQAHLDAFARRSNLAGAFAARRPVEGATVALVDDVLTTGATADACARALRAAGAAQVIVLTVGRTP